MSDVGKKWTLHEKPQTVGAPLCKYCSKPKLAGWTDAEAEYGRRLNAQTNTLEYHCYERYVDD